MTLVGLVVAAGTISGDLGLLAYIIAWITMPGDSRVPPVRSPVSAPTQAPT